jgi:pSer/pThr/pTyr-binding forkhead associated (FHA) protein
MNWNMILFITKWATIGLFYSVLLVLLFGVYREMSRDVRKGKTYQTTPFGRLRVISVGDDHRIPPGSILDLQAENRLGAEKDNDIVLRDSYVSGYHAHLRWDGKAWWLEDLNSKNGTLVNNQRCSPQTPHPLSNGSTLTIGDMEFEFIG